MGTTNGPLIINYGAIFVACQHLCSSCDGCHVHWLICLLWGVALAMLSFFAHFIIWACLPELVSLVCCMFLSLKNKCKFVKLSWVVMLDGFYTTRLSMCHIYYYLSSSCQCVIFFAFQCHNCWGLLCTIFQNVLSFSEEIYLYFIFSSFPIPHAWTPWICKPHIIVWVWLKGLRRACKDAFPARPHTLTRERDGLTWVTSPFSLGFD